MDDVLDKLYNPSDTFVSERLYYTYDALFGYVN